MKIVAMIPARLESSRLPGKALLDIGGLPMVVHTCLRTQLAKGVDAVYLATDSGKIREVAESHGIRVIMTGAHHACGSDRIAEAARLVESEVIINVQGDEALVNPEHIAAIARTMAEDPSVQCAIGVTEYRERNRGSDIKAVLDLAGNVLYCSRSDLPSEARTQVPSLLKMSFIVGFRTPFLYRYASWQPTPLELIEYNEYLRILEHGEKIRAVPFSDAKISVDTPEDLEIIRGLMAKDTLRHQYMQA